MKFEIGDVVLQHDDGVEISFQNSPWFGIIIGYDRKDIEYEYRVFWIRRNAEDLWRREPRTCLTRVSESANYLKHPKEWHEA